MSQLNAGQMPGVAPTPSPIPSAVPAPAVVPTPAPAPAPSPAPKPMEPQTLSQDAVVQLPDGRFATVTDLVDASQRALTPDQQKQFEQWQKIQSGDPEAIMAVLGVNKPQATPPVDPASEVSNLRQKVDGLMAQLAQVTPVVSEITSLQDEQFMVGAVKAHTDKLPHLARYIEANPQAGIELVQAMHQARETVRAAGQDPNTLSQQVKQQILARVLTISENRLQQMARVFGGGVQAPPQAGVTLVDDQPVNRGHGGASFNVLNGKMYNASGQEVVQTNTGKFVVVGGNIPSPGGTSGTMVSPSPAANPNGRMTREQFLQSVVARKQAMNVQQ